MSFIKESAKDKINQMKDNDPKFKENIERVELVRRKELQEKADRAKENIKKLFAENPDLKDAFKKTLEEMKKPENVEKMAKKMAKEIHQGINLIKVMNDSLVQVLVSRALDNKRKGKDIR